MRIVTKVKSDLFKYRYQLHTRDIRKKSFIITAYSKEEKNNEQNMREYDVEVDTTGFKGLP
jgi:hypothetical protein